MKPAAFLSIVGLAIAWPQTGSFSKHGNTVQPRAVTVTQADFDNFKFFAQYVASAYCNSNATVGSLVTCSNDACPDIEADGVVVQATFDSDTSTDTEGYISTNPARSLIVITFRGSVSLRNYLTDILFLTGPCDDLVSGCLAHLGFLGGWNDVKDNLISNLTALAAAHPTYAIVIAGYSLGGSVGTLAAGYLRLLGFKVDLYTYGSPAVGNDKFADFVTAQPGAEYRVTHFDDPVPRLPPLFLGYRHTSPEYWLDDGNATTVDYTLSDITVCEGNANVSCNGGTGGFDTTAHNYYFEHTAGCGSDEVPFRRDAALMSDADLEARFGMFSALNLDYAAALATA